MSIECGLVKEIVRLSLEEEEEGGLVLYEETGSEGKETQGLCLVGRFYTERNINFMEMKQTMASLWRPRSGVSIKELKNSLFLFQFFHEVDVSYVLDMSPWTFNNLLLLFHCLKLNKQSQNVKLFHYLIWVQVHQLSLGLKTEYVAMRINDYVGEFMEVNKNNFNGLWQSYMHVQVCIDIRQPLKRRMKIKQLEGDWVWVVFKYEGLPSFCLLCGRLGHTKRFCELLLCH
ncbi:hypothetical protein P3X46_026189 [Hevea brasiliensis]|uniref:CCHC-type domain-containing protein n=1 Tax=Hevea brasiliensis TaxID=3981 RepID=A0ABQ9KVT6_HEVBR|nr:hypothetical protein P3X46_026189 [Hevea brasiliensis]